MLLSKSRAANAGLAAAFREQRVDKMYLALGPTRRVKAGAPAAGGFKASFSASCLP